jgi:hypothetical protein
VLHEYKGHWPSNVAKDAKYSVRTEDGGWKVKLLYRVNSGDEYLLAAEAHDELVEMVNVVKRATSNNEGGAFYINEYHHVLVPNLEGRVYFAGEYDDYLEFPFNGGRIGPKAPDGLKPGDPWPGPHVGVAYTLAAGGNDIYHEVKLVDAHGQEFTRKVKLSDIAGAADARGLANRLAATKGSSGGRIYINEASEFFSPPANQGGEFIYLGHLEPDARAEPDEWFPVPPTSALTDEI